MSSTGTTTDGGGVRTAGIAGGTPSAHLQGSASGVPR